MNKDSKRVNSQLRAHLERKRKRKVYTSIHVNKSMIRRDKKKTESINLFTYIHAVYALGLTRQFRAHLKIQQDNVKV